MTNVLVCIKRVPDSSSEVVLTDDAQAVDGRYAGFTVSAARELRGRAGRPDRRRDGRRGDRGDPRVRRTRSSSCAAALAVGCTAATHVRRRRAVVRPGRRRPRDRRRGPRPRGRRAVPRPDPARQRRRRHRRLPGRHPAGLRARPPRRQRGRDGRGRPEADGDVAVARGEGPTARRPTGCRCRPSSPCSRAASSRATRPCSGRMKAKKIDDRGAAADRRPRREPSRVRLLPPAAVPSQRDGPRRGPGAAPRPWSTCSSELGVLAR